MAAVADPLNPYIAGSPVTDAKMFFGREDIFDWIQHSLAGQFADHILVIHGQRRVGKTSVLKQLPHRLPSRYIPVFFDLQGRTRTTLDRFLWWLAREIVRVLKQDRELILPLPEQEAFSRDLEYLESHFLPELRRLLPDHTLLLTFDEFDTLEEVEARETLGQPLTETLRRLMGREGLNFIFSIGSSGRKLENMQASYTEFFKAALYKKVSFLGQREAYNLITRPVEGVLEYQAEAVRAIYEITSGHPYFTQLVCHELFALCQRTGQRTVGPADVSGVLDDVVERGTVNLKFVWDEAGELERWSLAGLAHSRGELDSRALGDFLRKQRVRFSPPDLEAALIHLREKDVLTEQNAFVNQLLRRWLQRNRPLEQVREELTEVNPIANRYIEIGLEYLDSGLHEKAIQSFQEALEVDTDNLPALVHIGQAHLRQQAYAEAVSQFEQALSLDEEDVTARAGLCQAHLALGDLASTRGKVKEAQRSYQQILAINPEHTDARQRMADLSRQQAEKALAGGKDEEALSAFAQALAFTPEDQALEARVREVREQKRAAVLGALRERSDQALREQRWEQAAAALQDALALQPDDPDLLGKLAEARSGLRKSQQAAARTRAGGFAKAERWEEALAAWGEYLAFEPEDRDAAQGEIARVEKARSVAQSYARAQAALAKKDYDNAVSLLKAIVVEDEGYKDASRLMAEAIELRRARRRIWQSNWVRLGIAGVVLAGLAGLSLWAWPRLSTSPEATAAPTAAVAAPSAAAPTQTSRPAVAAASPTAPPTAIPLSWARLSSGQFLPRDRVTAIVIDPVDPGLIYVGTENAGVYKSIDGGPSWQPAHSGLQRATVLSLVMDPVNPAILYAGTELDGVYKSEDRAQSWRAVSSGIELPGWNDVGVAAIDRQNSQHLYYTHGFGLFETVDGGEGWRLTTAATCPEYHQNLVLHPLDGQILFLQGVDSGSGCLDGVYASRDGGRSWELSLGTEPHDGWVALAIDDVDGSRLYASDRGQLYGSQDGGASWRVVLDHPCDVVAFGPGASQVAYCAFGGRVQETRDSGATWRLLQNADVTAIAVSPTDPQSIWAGGSGLLYSGDGGTSWSERSGGLGAGHGALRIDPSDSSVLYLETSAGGLYRSTVEGQRWELIGDQGRKQSFDLSPGTLYRAGVEGILSSSDHGDTWTTIQVPEGSTFVGTNLRRPGALYAVTFQWNAEGPIYVSADNGRTWSEKFGYVPGGFPTVSVGSGAGERVYLVGDAWSMTRSDDAGETWQRCADIGYAARYGSPLTIDPRDDDLLYLAARVDGVLVSRNGCEAWGPSNGGLGSAFVNSIAIDPANPDTLYAGTDSGAYVSFDGGESWGEINGGLLGATVVYSIVVDPEGAVYAATPYGVFRLER